MRIGLIDFGGKQVNLALMKLSAWHKQRGDTVILSNFQADEVDKVYISVLFDEYKERAFELAASYKDAVIGGTGWDLTTNLPVEVEACKPDYDLYTVEDIYPRLGGFRGKKGQEESNRKRKSQLAQEIVDSGIGFISRGCVRNCKFCAVPRKEGQLHKVNEISNILNPRSNIVTILDANITANPDIHSILDEIIERDLIVNLTQGLDIRTMTPDLAEKISKVRFYGKGKGTIHYAWDLMSFEKMVVRGIKTLMQFVAKYRHMCYVLVGFDTTFEEDMYRVRRLQEFGIDPYIMRFHKNDIKTNHFTRWVMTHAYRRMSFDEYWPWQKTKAKFGLA